MSESQWVDAFCRRMSDLRVNADAQQIADLARELYPSAGHLSSAEAADAEWAEGPPHDD